MYTQFWILKSNGIHPNYCEHVLKRHIICSLGVVDTQSEGENIGQSELTKKKKARYLNNHIN